MLVRLWYQVRMVIMSYLCLHGTILTSLMKGLSTSQVGMRRGITVMLRICLLMNQKELQTQ